MKLYTAYLRPGRAPVLVREGFCWGAALFGPLWLALHRAWIAAVLALAVGIGLIFLGRSLFTAVLWLTFAWLLGLLGYDLWRWGLERRRYELTHVVVAPDAEAALLRLMTERPELRSAIVPAVLAELEDMKVAVVDYGSGNLASASRALVVAAERAGIAASVTVTADPEAVARADRIVLPGQGAFADCKHGLDALAGMPEAIERATGAGTPFLGICVGMQLMAARGLEHEITQGFGWVGGEIAAMTAPGLRLPQMGWNGLRFEPGAHPLLDGLAPGDHVYFVHSYALRGGAPAEIVATTEYGTEVVAMVAAGCRAGTQFHVEKSQEVGLRILGNFLRWTP